MGLLMAWSVCGPGLAYAEAGSEMPTFDCVIEPSEIIELGSASTGVLESVHVYRADRVRAGEEVARLESKVEEAALQVARLRAKHEVPVSLRKRAAELSERTRIRHAPLVNRSAVSQQEMDEIEVEAEIATLQVQDEEENLRIAREELRRARAIMERRIIRSPVDGVIMERFKTAGEFVEDEPILKIAKLHPLHVEVILPVEYLGRIQPFMKAEVVAAIPDAEPHIAEVKRVDLVADAASGTYGVQLELANPTQSIPAGLRCQVSFLSLEQTTTLQSFPDPAAGAGTAETTSPGPDTAPSGENTATQSGSPTERFIALRTGGALMPEKHAGGAPAPDPDGAGSRSRADADDAMPAPAAPVSSPVAEADAPSFLETVWIAVGDLVGGAVDGVGSVLPRFDGVVATAQAGGAAPPDVPARPRRETPCCLSLVPAMTRALSDHPERLSAGQPGVEWNETGYRVLSAEK